MARLGGDLQVSPQELMTDSSIQLATLGARATTGDGRVFRYVKCGGTALVPGKLYKSADEDSTNLQNLAVGTGAIGDTSVSISSSITLTANQLAGGFLCVTTSTGYGYLYRIKKHAATTSSTVTIYLEDPLQTTLSSSTSKVDMIANPYDSVVLWDASNHDGVPVGVAVYPITAAYYGWIQVGGPCCVLSDAGPVAVGSQVVASDDTDGAVGPYESDALYGILGTGIEGITSGEYGFVYLNMA